MIHVVRLLAVSIVALALAPGCSFEKTKTVSRATTETVATTVTKTIAPQPTVYVEQPGHLLYKPDTLSLGASSAILRIHWMTYGNATALGTGIWPKDDCIPNCAEGKVTRVPVKVRLLTRELCHGVMAYSEWSIIGTGFDRTPDVLASYENPC